MYGVGVDVVVDEFCDCIDEIWCVDCVQCCVECIGMYVDQVVVVGGWVGLEKLYGWVRWLEGIV